MPSASSDQRRALTVTEWMSIGAWSFGVLSVWDVLSAGAGWAPRTLASALGLGLFTGALHGAAFGVAFVVLSSARRWVPWVVWGALGVLAAIWQVGALGVLTRLGGEYRWLAIIGLVVSLAGGGLVSLLVALNQPTRESARGRVGELPRTWRWVVSSVLVAISFVLMWLDENVQKGGYPSAHLALEVAGFWAMFFAIAGALPAHEPPRRWQHALWLAPGLALVLTTLTLGKEHGRELGHLISGRYSSLALRTARALSDWDLDGYSGHFGGGDCGSFDASVHPGRREIPGNGIDDNCSLGDAPARNVGSEELKWPGEPSDSSIVLITIDTVAARYTSLHGDKKKTTPRLVKWAKDAAVFERAYTSGGWTSLALSSMFRGVYPRRLEWTRLYEDTRRRLLTAEELESFSKKPRIVMMFGLPLEDPGITLPELLQKRGMHTRAVVHDGKSEFLDEKFMSDGFDVYRDLDHPQAMRELPDDRVTREALRHLRRLPPGKPFFLWVHYFGPHLGNTRHKGTRWFGSSHADQYRHEIAYMDRHVGRLLKRVDRLAQRRSITTIVTSDHGEVVTKQGRRHGRYMLEDAIHVPFVIKGPDFAPGRYEAPVSLVDVFPTVVSLTGSPLPPDLDGMDLTRLEGPDDDLGRRIILSETWRLSGTGKVLTDKAAALDGELKLAVDLLNQTRALRRQKNEDDRENLIGTPGYDEGPYEEALKRHLERAGVPHFED